MVGRDSLATGSFVSAGIQYTVEPCSCGNLLLVSDVSSELDLEPGGIGSVPTGDGLGLAVALEQIEPYVMACNSLTGAPQPS